MTTNQQLIALYTIVRRETVRMFRIASQVFLPPVITTALYFLIFGSLIGQRIGPIAGMSYPLFIAPGLIIMTVITNAYGNVSTSLFNLRFQRSIEEILVSPVHPSLLLLGYVLGGVIRGIVVAILVFLVASFFVSLSLVHAGMSIFIVLLVAILFSLAGFTNAMVARNFDEVMLVPTFVLAPLTYLGGVFYSTHMLPAIWQTISHFNPIFYIVNAMRYALIGQSEADISISIFVISAIIAVLTAVNLTMLARGVGLRN